MSKRRKSMRIVRWPDYPEPKVRPSLVRMVRHSYMGEVKAWVCQEAIMRWWNYNIRPAPYRRRS